MHIDPASDAVVVAAAAAAARNQKRFLISRRIPRARARSLSSFRGVIWGLPIFSLSVGCRDLEITHRASARFFFVYVCGSDALL